MSEWTVEKHKPGRAVPSVQTYEEYWFVIRLMNSLIFEGAQVIDWTGDAILLAAPNGITAVCKRVEP